MITSMMTMMMRIHFIAAHICIKVPDIEKAAEKLIANGVEFINKPNEGNDHYHCYSCQSNQQQAK